MPWLSLLLRALLSLALVAGGIPGAAMASHAAVDHAATHQAATDQAATADTMAGVTADAGAGLPPCHGEPEPASQPPAGDDCCGSPEHPGCDCPCLGHLAAVERLPPKLVPPVPAAAPSPDPSPSPPAGIAATPLRPPIA
ncbi:CopL family metal-binding regulatory protein [Arenimonas fontis]|uniref:CopL family metal-binding regulatory protein n=1 Tax=Arenimonas fontis TaxID=2608255 RepID=A0A5B2ZEA7_9GAMM|nr:CopL family metal-binding regulatory protein [Arenimonas fontis]KAA2285963.1 CopL family metal-binding regulatory protein [Arenimonas fontis]